MRMERDRERGQAGQAERKRRFPDMFATPCSNHSVGKLPPRSSWAHLQATACSCSSQAVPSINDQAAKFRWDPFSICSPLQRSWEGQRYVLLTYGMIWICVFCLSTGTSKSHKRFLFPCNPSFQTANSTAVSVWDKHSEDLAGGHGHLSFKDLKDLRTGSLSPRKYRMAEHERMKATETDRNRPFRTISRGMKAWSRMERTHPSPCENIQLGPEPLAPAKSCWMEISHVNNWSLMWNWL